jgi:hypothetical protein
MNQKTDSPNPADLPLPKDIDYDNAFNYRQPKPEINSIETSDNEDNRRSSQITPINIPTPPDPKHLPFFALLEDNFKMASQGTGGNAQQIGNRDKAAVIPRANIVNIADVADQLAGLSIESQTANYLAPDDIVKKYKDLEIQQL